jgi:hypothetical protein
MNVSSDKLCCGWLTNARGLGGITTVGREGQPLGAVTSIIHGISFGGLSMVAVLFSVSQKITMICFTLKMAVALSSKMLVPDRESSSCHI